MTIYRGQGGLGDSYNDPELVHTSGDETIEGVKTFTSTIIGTASGHYTKAEEDTKLALKANQSTTFTKTEVNTLVDAKADQATTYTKTEVDTSLAGKLSSVPDNSVTTSKIADANVTTAKIAAGAVTPDKLSSTAQYMGFKNRIINGAMMIDQRNAGVAISADANGVFPVDRFSMRRNSGGGEFTGQQVAAPTGSKFTKALKLTVTTADASIAAGEYYVTRTKIEGFNIADLQWGTANAAPITISFEVYASVAGTYSVAVCNAANNRSYVSTFTVNAPNTTETKTITVAGDTSGTWLTDNSTGIDLIFNLGMGSTFSTSSTGSWQGAAYYAATGQTQLISTNGATFYITGVQLEKGSTATSFDYRPYGTELALCQRYYYKTKPPAANTPFGNGYSTSSTAFNCLINFPVSMRTNPTSLEQTGTAGDYAQESPTGATLLTGVPTFARASTILATITATTTGLTTGQGVITRCDNTNAYLAWSAEL